MLVNCQMGVSRSSAAVIALKSYFHCPQIPFFRFLPLPSDPLRFLSLPSSLSLHSLSSIFLIYLHSLLTFHYPRIPSFSSFLVFLLLPSSPFPSLFVVSLINQWVIPYPISSILILGVGLLDAETQHDCCGGPC